MNFLLLLPINANFYLTNLTNSSFKKTILIGTNFARALIGNSDSSYANLISAVFNYAEEIYLKIKPNRRGYSFYYML